jgi:hypothetical protein
MRYAFKALDFGASIVFIAMCAKAFWRHFYNGIEQPPQQQKLPLFKNSPSLVPAKGADDQRCGFKELDPSARI